MSDVGRRRLQPTGRLPVFQIAEPALAPIASAGPEADNRSVLPVAGVLAFAVLVQDTPVAADSATAASAAPRSRTTALPVVSYSDVTGLQYGAVIFVGFRVRGDSLTRPSSFSSYAAGTAKGHARTYLQLDRWSAGNSSRQRIRLEYLSYPLPFFGLGPDTPDSAEEWYSSGVSTVQLFTEREWRKPLYVHAGVRYVHSRLRELETPGVLQEGAVAGSSGSDVLTTELGLVIDSRDNVGATRTGTYARLVPSVATRVLGADFSFRRVTLDARRYQALATRHVLALQLQYDAVAGTVPFDQMPMIGADTAMRGYPRGRFRDRHAMTAQAEVRSAYWRRIGAVAFAGAGTVAPAFSKLGAQTWYPSVGAGVRYVLRPRQRTTARADLAFGRGTLGISVGIGEAF